MDDDDRVLACFDDFVEIADAAAAHGARERTVEPFGAGRRQQIATDEVRRGEILVTGDRDEWHATTATYIPLRQAPGHVLEESRLAAARGPFEQHRHALAPRRFEQGDLVTHR